MLQAHSNFVSGQRQSGIGMIEVLVSLLVIGLGVAGMVKLQGSVFREGGNAKAHALAAQLARGKLDDLRSFSQLAAGAAGIYGYDEIGDNAGGSEKADGSLKQADGEITVSNTTYTRSWKATGYYYCTPGAAPTTAACAPAKPRPDFYAVKVSISWTEQDGTTTGKTNTEILEDSVSAFDPLKGSTALINGPSSSPPLVGYRPGQAPQVLAIDIGDSQKKETTNPTPTLNKKGRTIKNTIATYETIRYSGSDNTITREQFVTLNCSCTQQGLGEAYNLLGNKVSKSYGVPSDADQAAQCKICCRDHHDDKTCDVTSSTGRNGCYDPYRPVGDYLSSGDHRHYTANGSPADNAGDTYVEACRLRRTDGYLRVVQDWRMVAINVIPQDFFAPGNRPDDTAITNYGNYVKAFIASLVTGGSTPAKIWPTSVIVKPAKTYQLNARGLYLDYLDDDRRAALAARINAGDASVYQDIPFYEVNLTKLAQWNSDADAVATVSHDALVSESPDQNLYSRGLVTAVSAGSAKIRASATAGNTGVIDEFITTDPDDGAIVLDDVSIIMVPGNSVTISDVVTPAVPVNINFVLTNNGGSCSYSTGNGAYSCIVPSGWSGSLTPFASGYRFAPTSYSFSNVTATLNSGHSFTSTAAGDLMISGTITPAVSGVSLIGSGTGNSAGIAASCSYTDATGAYRCSVPNQWSGNIVPSVSGYRFTPTQHSYSDLSASQSGQDFTAATVATSFTLSGTISPALTAVGFIADAGAACSYTSVSGAYSCKVPSGWSGQIKPSANGYSFTPGSRVYANVTADQGSQDFASLAASGSFTISGGITPTVSGVTVNGTGSSGSANVNCIVLGGGSSYSCTVPSGWSGSVMAAANGVRFTPSAYSYNTISANQTGQNFTGNFTVSGIVAPAIAGVSFAATNGASCNDYDAATGAYSCSVPNLWTGSITPNAAGHVFAPSSRSYSNVTSSYTADNYTVSSGNSITFQIAVTTTGLTKVTSTTVTATAGASCDTNPGINHICTVTVAAGKAWSGIITMTPSLTGGKETYTPNDANIKDKGSKSYTDISSDQTLNFACSGGGC